MSKTQADEPLIWDRRPANAQQRATRLWLGVLGVNVLGAIILWSLMYVRPEFVAQHALIVKDAAGDSPFSGSVLFGYASPSNVHSSPYSFGWVVRLPWPSEPISFGDACTAIVLAIFSTSLVAAPFISFLSHGWYARFDEFRNSLKDGALFAYLRRFWAARLLDAVADYRKQQGALSSGNYIVDKEDLIDMPQIWTELEKEAQPYIGKVFSRIYQEQFGLLPFLPPFVLLVTITYAASVSIVFINYCAAGIQTCPGYFFGAPPNLVISAMSGAYMFTVADSVMSIRRRSLNVSDVYWYALRQFLAVPIASFFSSSLPVHGAAGIATTTLCFVVALLPVDVLLKQLRRVAYVAMSSNPAEEQGDQLLKLRGMTSPVVTLFLSEGVYSVEQVATADPVLLAIRTGLPFRLVLVFGSQAIVRRHFGDESHTLLRIGFADATAVYNLMSRDAASSSRDVVCKAICECLGETPSPIPVEVVKMKLEHIALEEYTQMVAKLTPLSNTT
jgi:hypothetical protein